MADTAPILAIETSGENCSACIYFDGKKYTELTVREKNVHSEKLLHIIDQLLITVGIELKQVRALAVSSGPGSFTGLRIGMSAAKGLALGCSLPVIAVPTFEALALQISSVLKPDTPFIISNKVNMEETYWAKFRSGHHSYTIEENIRVIQNAELQDKIDNGIAVYGNSVPVTDSEFFHKELNIPSACWVAKWAYSFGKDLVTLEYDFLEPAYFKNFIVR